jgi:type I restriction enzyme S subunit
MSWPHVALGEICSPKQHKTIPSSALLSEGYPVFGANGQIGFYSEYTHAQETIAITCRGATCGTINVAPAMSYITGNAMALDKLDNKRVDLRFLVYALRHRGLRDVISGSAQPQITRGPLVDLTIPLPPLGEQKRIAQILDQAALIKSHHQQGVERAGELLNSLSSKAFSGRL